MNTTILVITLSLTLSMTNGSLVAQVHANDLVDTPNQACAAIPGEPLDEADAESADYGVGLLFREYDLDGDGRPEFMTATQFDVQASPGAVYAKPLFYWFDLNADSTYDQMWIDQGGQGRCDDIVLYRGPAQGRTLLALYTELAGH